MICKYCNAEMEKRYSFSKEGNEEKLVCPICKASTKAKPIEYDEEGMIPSKKKRKREEPKKQESA